MLFAEKKQACYEESINRRIERYWDRRSEDFSSLRRRELKGTDGQLWLDLMERHLPEGKHLRILDAGTGAGFFAILLSGCGHQVTGIDLSAEMIREAKKNMMEAGCRVDFCRMSAQELEFSDGIFDAVVSRNLTWTLPDVMEAYREWHRVLKPGGVLMNFDSDCGKLVFSKTDDQSNVHAGIEDELIAECNEIKDSLRITSHSRPEWDIRFLKSLGLSVECEENIAPMVHRDPDMRYDNVPLFAIYGKKLAGH